MARTGDRQDTQLERACASSAADGLCPSRAAKSNWRRARQTHSRVGSEIESVWRGLRDPGDAGWPMDRTRLDRHRADRAEARRAVVAVDAAGSELKPAWRNAGPQFASRGYALTLT